MGPIYKKKVTSKSKDMFSRNRLLDPPGESHKNPAHLSPIVGATSPVPPRAALPDALRRPSNPLPGPTCRMPLWSDGPRPIPLRPTILPVMRHMFDEFSDPAFHRFHVCHAMRPLCTCDSQKQPKSTGSRRASHHMCRMRRICRSWSRHIGSEGYRVCG